MKQEADLAQVETSPGKSPKHVAKAIPNYWEIYPLLIVWFLGIVRISYPKACLFNSKKQTKQYYSGFTKYILIYYLVYPLISPFGDWGLALRYFFRMLRPFEGYPLSFKYDKVTHFFFLADSFVFLPCCIVP